MLFIVFFVVTIFLYVIFHLMPIVIYFSVIIDEMIILVFSYFLHMIFYFAQILIFFNFVVIFQIIIVNNVKNSFLIFIHILF